MARHIVCVLDRTVGHVSICWDYVSIFIYKNSNYNKINQIRHNFRRQRLFKDRTNPLEYLDDEQLLQKYRFNRGGILFIVEVLTDRLGRATNRCNAIPVLLQVLASLYYMACGSFQRVVADSSDINLSQASVSRIVTAFTDSICQFKQLFIKFPTEINTIQENQQKFFTDSRIPNVVGLVDGTHIQIIRPSENEEAYVNRLNYHSVNVQIISNYDCHITNIVSKWPGSVHDSTVLNESSIRRYFDNPRNISVGILLGDSGYPCKNWLLTPYRRPDNPQYTVLYPK